VISPEQVRAARKLLRWDCLDLAIRVGVSETTIAKFGKESPTPRLDPAKVRAALEAAGVEFTNGEQPGVRLKQKPTGTPTIEFSDNDG
jgi:DNA-binding XRE family transcriptional regulator